MVIFCNSPIPRGNPIDDSDWFVFKEYSVIGWFGVKLIPSEHDRNLYTVKQMF